MPRVPKMSANVDKVKAVGAAMAEQAAVGLAAVTQDAELQVEAADDMLYRLRRTATRAGRLIERGRLPEAALAAGQVAMLGRQIEIRLLGAVERRRGGLQVAEAVMGPAPTAQSPMAVKRRMQQRTRRARATE